MSSDMEIKIYWTNLRDLSARAHLLSSGGDTRQWDITNVQEFIDEYYKDKTRPVPPPPYWTRDSHIATLTYYLDRIDKALTEPDALEKVREIMREFNTPVAVA